MRSSSHTRVYIARTVEHVFGNKDQIINTSFRRERDAEFTSRVISRKNSRYMYTPVRERERGLFDFGGNSRGVLKFAHVCVLFDCEFMRV